MQPDIHTLVKLTKRYKIYCKGFVKHHKTSALSITIIRIPGIHVSRSSSQLVACVQTSPLSQKKTYFF